MHGRRPLNDAKKQSVLHGSLGTCRFQPKRSLENVLTINILPKIQKTRRKGFVRKKRRHTAKSRQTNVASHVCQQHPEEYEMAAKQDIILLLSSLRLSTGSLLCNKIL